MENVKYIGHLGRQDHDDSLALNAEHIQVPNTAKLNRSAILIPFIVGMPWFMIVLGLWKVFHR